MMTNVVSGIAMILAKAPYTPALWKWYTAIGISAASTTMPVSSSDASPRSRRTLLPSSRSANQPLTRGCSCNATIATIAAKDSWKLGPISASGRTTSTMNAPAATSRSVTACRPSARAARTSNVATHDRIVGTCDPVNQV